jgi:hypothetical protein
VINMASTVAKIGRSMKKDEIFTAIRLSEAPRPRRSVRLRP